MLETVKEAKIGSIVPLLREIDHEIDALDYFSKASNCGKSRHSLLFQHGNYSFGTASPCIMVSGKGMNFEIKALNETGKRILALIKKDFGFCDKVVYNRDRIHGALSSTKKTVSEDQRLASRSHMDIISVLANRFSLKGAGMPSCGLLGMFSPGFISGVPDETGYLAYFADNMFLVDHAARKSYFIAGAVITDHKREKTHADCIKTLNNFEKLLQKKAPKLLKAKKKKFEVQHASGKEELLASIKDIRRSIAESELLFANASSVASCNFYGNPLELYASYRRLNPGNTYYISHDEGINISSFSGTGIIVNAGEREISLSMSTSRPLRKSNAIDADTQNKKEAALKSDEGEIIRHVILADCARNEMARVCKTGTRHLESLFSTDSYGGILLKAKGMLREGLNELCAAASMMNFWNGITKQRAFELSTQARRQSLGFHSGAIVMAYPGSSIEVSSINSLALRKDKITVAASSAVFHSSNDEHEAEKNSAEMELLLSNIKEAGGMK